MSAPKLKLGAGPVLKPSLPALKTGGGAKLKGREAQPANAEADSVAELNELQQAFKDRAEADQQRFVEATDSEYWFAVCFQTREQKEEFLRKTGLGETDEKYLNGLEVARKLGVAIEAPTPPIRKTQFHSRWLKHVRKGGE